MSVPMPTLFRTCAEILAETYRPWHYAELTRRALGRLGVRDAEQAMRRSKEDVREKMLEAGQFHSAYIGRPHCLAVLSHWFPSRQQVLINPPSPVHIKGNTEWAIDAAYSLLRRDRHMIQKTAAREEVVLRARAQGVVIEQHVAQWFRESYPEYWEPADNEGQWAQWCDHDFKLMVPGNVWRVDVMGPRLRTDLYGTPKGGGKRPVELHVLARVDGPNIVIDGFTTGSRLRELFGSEESMPIAWLLVRLNCFTQGLDWHALRRTMFKDVTRTATRAGHDLKPAR